LSLSRTLVVTPDRLRSLGDPGRDWVVSLIKGPVQSGRSSAAKKLYFEAVAQGCKPRFYNPGPPGLATAIGDVCSAGTQTGVGIRSAARRLSPTVALADLSGEAHEVPWLEEAATQALDGRAVLVVAAPDWPCPERLRRTLSWLEGEPGVATVELAPWGMEEVERTLHRSLGAVPKEGEVQWIWAYAGGRPGVVSWLACRSAAQQRAQGSLPSLPEDHRLWSYLAGQEPAVAWAAAAVALCPPQVPMDVSATVAAMCEAVAACTPGTAGEPPDAAGLSRGLDISARAGELRIGQEGLSLVVPALRATILKRLDLRQRQQVAKQMLRYWQRRRQGRRLSVFAVARCLAEIGPASEEEAITLAEAAASAPSDASWEADLWLRQAEAFASGSASRCGGDLLVELCAAHAARQHWPEVASLARTALARIDNCEALLSRGPERIEATAEQALYAMARLGQMEDASRLAAKLGWADPKPVWETLQAVSSLVQKERLGEAVRLAQALEAEDLRATLRSKWLESLVLTGALALPWAEYERLVCRHGWSDGAALVEIRQAVAEGDLWTADSLAGEQGSGIVRDKAAVALLSARQALDDGRYDAVWSSMEDYLAGGDVLVGSVPSSVCLVSWATMAACVQGRRRQVARALELLDGLGELALFGYMAKVAQGSALGLMGEVGRAQSLLWDAVEEVGQKGYEAGGYLAWSALLRFQRKHGTPLGVRRALEGLVTAAHRCGTPVARWHALDALAGVEMDRHYAQEALNCARETGRPVLLALANLRAASVGLGSDDALPSAYSSLRQLGIAPAARFALGKLRSEGIPPPRSRRAPVLSQLDRRLVELVRAGATNRQAAMELCVSEKTVEKHLAHLMRRFGCRTRWELCLRFPKV